MPILPSLFTGLSAFPLTPLRAGKLNESAFTTLMQRLVAARVDSICVLGSTGNYAYLEPAIRRRVAELALRQRGDVPLIVGIGALRTDTVLALAEHAQDAGADGVLLAPISYQRLTDAEVFGLYETVARSLSVPLCVYDNPSTTHFSFSDELHGRIAQLPQVRSIKIPGVPGEPAAARERVAHLRALVPPDVTLGVSGDALGVAGLIAGCDAWYSVVAGLFPEAAKAMTRAAQSGQSERAKALSAGFDPLWRLFAQHGSLRPIATAAELLGLVASPCLPLPLLSLQGAEREQLAAWLRAASPS